MLQSYQQMPADNSMRFPMISSGGSGVKTFRKTHKDITQIPWKAEER